VSIDLKLAGTLYILISSTTLACNNICAECYKTG